jgi:hypothetical protein
MKKLLLITTILALSVPAYAQDRTPKVDPANPAPVVDPDKAVSKAEPAKPKKYNSVATAAWDDEQTGKHISVVSYAESPDAIRAEDLAMKGCFAKGGKECKAHGPWDAGCIYASVFTSGKTGHKYWVMREKEEDLFKHAREKNYAMAKPIGGCVSAPEEEKKVEK